MRLIALITLLALVGCADQQTDYLARPTGILGAARGNQLIIGIGPDYAPVCYFDGSKAQGIEADFGRMLADQLDLQPVFVSVPFSDLRTELAGGRVDIIMAGMSVTEARQRMMLFTDPYMTISQRAIVRTEHADRFPDAQAINKPDVRIAVGDGTTGERFARSQFGNATLYPFTTFDRALSHLQAGKVDVMIHDSLPLRYRANRDATLTLVPGRFTREPIAWAVRRGNQPLVDRINPVIAQWQQAGTIDEVLNKWLSK